MSIKLLIADDEDTVRNGIAKYIQLHTDGLKKYILPPMEGKLWISYSETNQTSCSWMCRCLC